ncbi:hypothetical protein NPIL_401171, partial [Nephila pilipes]
MDLFYTSTKLRSELVSFCESLGQSEKRTHLEAFSKKQD